MAAQPPSVVATQAMVNTDTRCSMASPPLRQQKVDRYKGGAVNVATSPGCVRHVTIPAGTVATAKHVPGEDTQQLAVVPGDIALQDCSRCGTARRGLDGLSSSRRASDVARVEGPAAQWQLRFTPWQK